MSLLGVKTIDVSDIAKLDLYKNEVVVCGNVAKVYPVSVPYGSGVSIQEKIGCSIVRLMNGHYKQIGLSAKQSADKLWRGLLWQRDGFYLLPEIMIISDVGNIVNLPSNHSPYRPELGTYYTGAADIVFEISSHYNNYEDSRTVYDPQITFKKDIALKSMWYKDLGIKQYYFINTKAKCVMVFDYVYDYVQEIPFDEKLGVDGATFTINDCLFTKKRNRR